MFFTSGSCLCSNVPTRANKLSLEDPGVTWKYVLVKEIVDNRDLLAKIVPELCTLGFIVHT